MTDFLYYLDQIHPVDRKHVGERAFFLSILRQRQYSVMPGVVVSSDALRQFLQEIQWLEPLFADLSDSSLHLDVTNSRQLQSVAQQIRRGIHDTPLDPAWLADMYAVVQQWQVPMVMLQPSLALAIESDPMLSQRTFGLLKSRICPATLKDLVKTLKEAWSELFRAKSLFYWQRSGVQLPQINLAILVQPLYPALVSGDLHINQTSLELRSSYGLGSLAEGIAVPDWYRIDLLTHHQDHHIGSKNYALQLATPTVQSHTAVTTLSEINSGVQVVVVQPAQQQQLALTPAQLHQLMRLAEDVQTELRMPISLEWAILEQTREEAPTIIQVHPQFTETTFDPHSVTDTIELPPLDSPFPALVTAASVAVSSPLSGPSPVLKGLAASPGRALAPAWVVRSPLDKMTIPANVILVLPTLLPSHMTLLPQAVGIVTSQGGMTSHGAILARELKIPAVVGVGQAIDSIETGDVVFVDGSRGVVYRVDDSGSLPLPEEADEPPHLFPATEAATSPFTTLPVPMATQLLVNLSYADHLMAVAALPIDGVGLLRSELMLRPLLEDYSQHRLTREGLIEQIAHQIQRFARAFTPRSVFYRSLDVRSHELANPRARPLIELNPALGLHGTFSYQIDSTLFEMELAALRRVQQGGDGNVHLVLPFVRTVEEFRFCRQRVVQAALTEHPQFQLWIMAEVPSVLFLLPDYVEAGVQGISIGSNDLTQFILAVDRDHPEMADAFDQRHPAVLRAIRQLVQTARQHGIGCSICGQVPVQHPELIADFVRWGVTAISVSPDALEQTRLAIARAEHALLLDTVRQLKP